MKMMPPNLSRGTSGIGIIIFVLLIALVGGGFYFLSQTSKTSPQQTSTTPSQEKSTIGTTFTFTNPKKSAHYESNTPAHASILAGVPINVVIDFNFDLAVDSTILIMKDEKEYGTGQTTIDKNKLSMRRTMDPTAPDGLYTAKYKACWPDGSCHDGNFQFVIDRAREQDFVDMRGKIEVTINLSQFSFKPQNVRISRGTKITWVNDDAVDHYVNTDSHPAHSYHPQQNSQVLKKGDTYSVTFMTPGVYPYHCSAHADSMIGTLLVE